MSLTLTFLTFTVVCCGILFFLLRRYRSDASAPVWFMIEGLWLIVSLVGLSYGLNQFEKSQKINDFHQEKATVDSHFQNIRHFTYGQLMFVEIDNNSTEAEKETYKWFTKIISLLDNGPADNRWWQFVNYTKGSVFNEKGYIIMGHENQLVYNWPTNFNFKPTNVLRKDLMRQVINRVDEVVKEQTELTKKQPDTSEKKLLKYLVSFVFCFGLSAKMMKVWYDFIRNRETNKLINPLISNNLWNRYNIAAFCGILLISVLCWFTLNSNLNDSNGTYYMISVSAIYATILLTYLLQKIFLIRQQKEMSVNTSRSLWMDTTNYRYLCRLLYEHLQQSDLRNYRQVKKLKVDRLTLQAYKFQGDETRMDPIYWSELSNMLKEKKSLSVDFIFLVKQLEFFCFEPDDISVHVNSINRVFAYSHKTINKYINGMIQNPVFHLTDECHMQNKGTITNIKEFYESIEKQSFFKGLIERAELNPDTKTEQNLRLIERYILNQVLLKLNDHTKIIEKKLPAGFIHLLINSVVILVFGTVIPLVNAFIFDNLNVTKFCGAVLIGSLVLSVIYLTLTFYAENDANLFKDTDILYEEK